MEADLKDRPVLTVSKCLCAVHVQPTYSPSTLHFFAWFQKGCIYRIYLVAHILTSDRSRKNSFRPLLPLRAFKSDARTNPPKACRYLPFHSRACSDLASTRIAIHSSLDIHQPCRDQQVVPTHFEKVALLAQKARLLGGAQLSDDARARVWRAQTIIFPSQIERIRRHARGCRCVAVDMILADEAVAG